MNNLTTILMGCMNIFAAYSMVEFFIIPAGKEIKERIRKTR